MGWLILIVALWLVGWWVSFAQRKAWSETVQVGVALLIGSMFMAIWLGAGDESDKVALPPSINLPLDQYAQALAGDDAKVSLTEQLYSKSPNKTYLVEITLKGPDAFWGGAQDWNRFATTVHHIGEPLMERPDVARVRIESDVPMTDGKVIGWAYADMDKKTFPQNFRDLTYLQFAGAAKLDAGTLQTGKWLCEFYKEYESAQPSGGLDWTCRPD